MKDHQIAELVNAVTAELLPYTGTACTRTLVSKAINSYMLNNDLREDSGVKQYHPQTNNKIAHVIQLNDSVEHVHLGSHSEAVALKLKLRKQYEKKNPHFADTFTYWHINEVPYTK